MSKLVHLHISVRGLLGSDRRELARTMRSVTKTDGTRFATVDEFRNALMDGLANGYEVLPIGTPCEGFDYKTGCPGHHEVSA